MKKTKTENKTKKANTPAELIASGDLIVMDEVMSKKAGIAVKVAMPKKDYLAFEIDKAMGEKKAKKVKALLNAVVRLVVRCQRTNVKANAVVRLDTADFPTMVMTVHQMAANNPEAVLIIQKMKEAANGKA